MLIILSILMGVAVGLLLAWGSPRLVPSGSGAWARLGAALRRPRRRWEQARRQRLLAEQMPQLLEALSAALRAGQSLTQALASAQQDLPEPSAGLLRQALAQVQLGQALEQVLIDLAQDWRGSLLGDWRLFATAVGIQRQSGGDLGSLLDQLTETLRERQRLLAQVDALTAQGRLSAWVVGLLPLALLLALELIDPDLVAPLFCTQKGWALLAAAALLEALGVVVLRGIVRIEA